MKKLHFVVSLITNDNDYQRQQASAAQQTAARLGVELDICFAGNDAIKQSDQILDVIHARKSELNGILVEPAGRTAFPKLAQAAASAGIAWVVMNCDADYLNDIRARSTVPVFMVSADNHEVGRIQGRQLAALLPNGGSVLYIQGPSQSTVTEQRAAGMLQTKPETVTVRLLKSTNWTGDGGFHATNSWLRLSTAQREHFNVIQAQNDALALGARRAFEDQSKGAQNNHRTHLPFLGVDGLPQTGQAWVRQGLLAATVVIPAVTPNALESLVSAINNRVQPPDRTLVAPESFPRINDLLAKQAPREGEKKS